MVEHKVILSIKTSTKIQFQSILEEFKNKYPDHKINQDYVLRQLMNKFEGDLQ